MLEGYGGKVLELLLGFVFLALAWMAPARVMRGRLEIGWDVAGLVTFVAVSALLAPVLEGWAYPLTVGLPGLRDWVRWVESWPAWLLVPLNLLVADLALYWAHRALHLRGLWSTHAWHHSPSYLYFLSGMRNSPVETLAMTGPATAAYVLMPFPDGALMAFGIAMLYAANAHFTHTNMRVPFTEQIEWVLATPRFHFVHHCEDQRYSDTNYGFVFTFWDRLFGTYTDPAQVPADAPLGLNYSATRWRLLLGLPEPR